MKKIFSILILIVLAIFVSGCTNERKYAECVDACEGAFTSITPSKIDENYEVISTVKMRNSGYAECRQICIEKYK